MEMLLLYPFYNPFCGLVFCKVWAEEEDKASVVDQLAAKNSKTLNQQNSVLRHIQHQRTTETEHSRNKLSK